MLNFAVPSAASKGRADAPVQDIGPGCGPGTGRGSGWVDWNEPPPEPRRWSREEAQALARREPSLSPWRVVAAQVLLGVLCAGIAWMLAGQAAALSALYGAAVVVVAGALMARGSTSPLTAISPLAGAVRLMAFAVVKTGVVLVMLMAAPRVLPGLVWLALLATMAACLQTYWLALAVRPKPLD